MAPHPSRAMEASIQIVGDKGNVSPIAVHGQCLSICEGGLMLQLAEPIPLRSEVAFRVKELSLEGTGTVCQCGNIGNYSMVGLEFL